MRNGRGLGPAALVVTVAAVVLPAARPAMAVPPTSVVEPGDQDDAPDPGLAIGR